MYFYYNFLPDINRVGSDDNNIMIIIPLQALRLYPLPDVIILADKFDGYNLTYMVCLVLTTHDDVMVSIITSYITVFSVIICIENLVQVLNINDGGLFEL